MKAVAEEMEKDFCVKCRKETEFQKQKRSILKTIRNRDYTFRIAVAICTECGRDMSPHGLNDQNIREVNEQYLAMAGVTIGGCTLGNKNEVR